MDIDRAVDRAALAVVLCLPLLPAGPAYLGFEPRPWLHAAVLLLLAIPALAMAHRAPRSGAATAARRLALLDLLGTAWAVLVAAAVGATIVGLAAENDLASPVFRYNLKEAWRLLWPVDRVWDPLYPLHAGLVFVEGLLAYIGVRALCLYADDPQRRARAVLRGWTYGFGVVSAFAVFQYLTRFRLHPFWIEVNPELTRSHATLDDPNALGSYLTLGIPLCLGLAAAGGRRAKVAVALATLGTLGLLASASRAAIGGLLLAGLAAAAVPTGAGDNESTVRAHLRRGTRWLLAAAAAVLVASLLVRLTIRVEPVPYRPGNVGAALTSVFDPRVPLAALLEQRGIWWSAALRMASNTPVLGVGLGRFPGLLSGYAPPGAGAMDAHNLFLQVLAEMGIVGLLTFGAFLGAVFVTLARLGRSSEGPAARLAGGALIGSVAYVATFVTGHPLLLTSGQVLWATMLAAVVVAAAPSSRVAGGTARRPDEDGGPSTPPAPRIDASRRRARTALLCAGVIAIYAAGVLWSPPFVARQELGYSYGLYAEEINAEGRPFRWTAGLAVLQLPAPPDATELRTEVTVSPALRSGRSTRVRVSLDRDGSRDSAPDREDFNLRRVSAPASYTVSLRPADDHRFGGHVFLRIEVEPTFVPARQGSSEDRRELGVRISPPTFIDGGR